MVHKHQRRQCAVAVRGGSQAQTHRSAKRKPSCRRENQFRFVECKNCARLPASAATAAATATLPTTATSVSPAIATSASAIASASSGVLSLGARLVYVQRAAADLRAVQRRDGFLSIFVAGHFHKAEAARTSGIAIGHNAHPLHLPKRFEHLPRFVFRCVKAQISDKNILHASTSALTCRSASSIRRTGRSG